MGFWQKLPALRLLIPLIAGILLQWYCRINVEAVVLVMICLFTLLSVHRILRIKKKFQLVSLTGIAVHLLIMCAAMLLVWVNDSQYMQHPQPSETSHLKRIARLNNPLSEKQNSFSTTASVLTAVDRKVSKDHSDIIIYFRKDSTLRGKLSFGSLIVFQKPLQRIRNSGNPGAFDYQRYCHFQGIHHQVFLEVDEFLILPNKKTTILEEIIFSIRSTVISILKNRIPGKKEQGLAEALLIGYKDDLDKELVQAYSNTGVVHVIAISGLHLGIIYTILLLLTKPLNRRRYYWLRFIIIFTGIWLFSVVAGAQASVLRSAVMFTCLAAGTVLQRKGSMINTLALSAFLLLCWKPYWLWDVGFQLSYLAVLSIVLFFKPVYHWFTFRYRVADMIWKLTAVTISAQILTFPITIYYFHQFPIILLFTNLVAVPLSSLILIGELLLLAVNWFEPFANITGFLIQFLITFMNEIIERANKIEYGAWQGLSISFIQLCTLYFFVGSMSIWLLQQQKKAAVPAAFAILIFFALRSYDFMRSITQQKLVVYNISGYAATDIFTGRKNIFIGDSASASYRAAERFHLSPSRVLHRTNRTESLQPLVMLTKGANKLLFVTTGKLRQAGDASVIFLSKNAQPEFSTFSKQVKPMIIVADGTVPLWKVKTWRKECSVLQIRVHHVTTDGPFVMNF